MNAPADAARLRLAPHLTPPLPHAPYAPCAPIEAACDAARASAVSRLCAALDAAFASCATPADPSCCGDFARGVRAALTRALAEPALLAPAQREGLAGTYRRHVIAADACGRYTVAALVWQPGQASPIHAHRTWCGYAVLEGALTETLYAWDAARAGADIVRSHPRASGAVAFAGRGRAGIHRLSNGGLGQAISLHVYGVAAAGIATEVNDVVPLIAHATA
ncbi:cysteine dioxygenase family protein [Paraburkholderia acidisoli]|uniref:Cysteine dioxygenase n=1 Tax=Paraburkholderia acidisoli TaxID=2571748 RepID=A0A7Z2JFA0_9BURK|nr:cysteine dioxygenase family protein [Paraburkholderia acidisoli]QGZ61733.1 cysteine dioxygenase [Paraburkholderia acidisoli]